LLLRHDVAPGAADHDRPQKRPITAAVCEWSTRRAARPVCHDFLLQSFMDTAALAVFERFKGLSTAECRQRRAPKG